MVSNDLFYKLKALYLANDGGFSPSVPMKMYHGFMIDKINEANSSKLKKLVWCVIYVATGILAYPILGFFAAFDMAVNLLDWHLNGKKHNTESSNLKAVFFNVHGAPASGYSLSFKLTSNSSLMTPVLKNFREYDITFGPETIQDQFKKEKLQLADEMKAIVERFTNAYTKVYIHYSGSWEHGMKIKFLAADSLLPYCSNPLLPSYEKITYSPRKVVNWNFI